MHSHIPTQEIGLLAAPLIVRSEADLATDRQEMVLFLHDFSFTPPEELLAGLTGGMDNMAMDLNDVDFDAYLANDHTLDDPEVITVERGGRERTGLILAPKGATVARIAGLSEADHPAFSADLTQEAALRALDPLAARAPDRSHMVMLGGAMMPYLWTMNGQTYGNHTPIPARSGERVEITFHNMSMMAHPMHLHGHVFQVVGLGRARIPGALRDTVQVPPMSMVTLAFDAGEAAPWMLHCHHMGHLATGMMTELAVSA